MTADEHRTPKAAEGPVLDLYAGLLALIGDACHAEADRLLGSSDGSRRETETETTMDELHRRLQEGLREQGQGAARTAVLGTLVLQAENRWAEIVSERDESAVQ